MTLEASVDQEIEDKSAIFGSQVSNLVKVAQPKESDVVRCPHCFGDFNLNDEIIPHMDLEKVAVDVQASAKKHMRHVAEMATQIKPDYEKEISGRDEYIEELEKSRERAETQVYESAMRLKELAPMVTALANIGNVIVTAKSAVGDAIRAQKSANDVVALLSTAMDRAFAEVQAVTPKASPAPGGVTNQQQQQQQ